MVYVDDMYAISLGAFGRMKMSHMMADTTDELLAMVDKIGVKRKWLQKPETKLEHFDISLAKRKLAIEKGTIPVSMRQLSAAAMKRDNQNDRLIIDE